MKTKLNRFYVYCIVLITLFFGVNNHVNAQCDYDNTLEETWTAPGSLGDSVYTDCIYAGKFIRVTDMVSGEVYQISTCGNSNFDSQITIYPASGGSSVDYNDDACGSQSEIIFIPPSNGDYDILIDEYYCGPANTTCMYLLVKKIPCPAIAIEYADMYISPDFVCPDANVNFDVDVSGSTVSAYLWNFGDGNTSSQKYTSHSYTSAGTYEVSLTLTNGCGNDTVLYDTVHIMNNLPFTADSIGMYVSSNFVCSGDNVFFEVYVSGNRVSAYLWDFGDGNTFSDHYTSHSYTSAGTYDVSLTLTNGCGNDTVLYDTIHVINDLPFTADSINMYVNPDSVCPGNNVNFDVYVYGNPVSDYLWNFGDGNTYNQKYTSHSYTSAGTYEVSLTLTNGCGNDTVLYDTVHVMNNLPFTADNIGMYIYPYSVCPGDNVFFEVYVSGSTVSSYLWDFDDGNTSNQEETSHSYTSTGTYEVSLTLTNGCGNDTVLYDIVYVVDNLPVSYADMYISQNPVCPNDEIYFYAYPDVSSYHWDFGDGSTSNEENTYHSYTSLGTYPITLTLTNNCNSDTTLYDTVYVVDNLPVSYADMYISQNPVCPNDEIYFNADSDVNSYHWDFGDGSTSNEKNTYHSYTSLGTYPITLTLTNNCGNDTTLYDTIEVVNNLPFTANYIDVYVSPNSVCPSDNVDFHVYVSGSTVSSYLWNFDDGNTSNQQHTSHSYTSAGTYEVSLTLTNGCGNDTVLYNTIYVGNNVHPDPDDYDYDVVPNEACPDDTVLFIVNPSGSSYLWDFGDGNTTTLTTEYETGGYIYDIAKHVYSSTGNYTVTFTLTNGCGNSFTDYFNVDIDDNVPVDGWFWWYPNNPSVNENIEFSALGGSSYQWDFGDGSAVITSTLSLTPVNHSYASPDNYTVSVTMTNSCGNSETYTENINIDLVGIQNNNLSDNDFLNIYPNPNNGSFTMEIDNNDKEKLMLQIMNITGQIIYTKELGDKSNITHKINLSNHSKGIFLVKVQSKEKYEIKKVIIY